LADVPAELQLDPDHRVTPIDVGDVCVNWWTDALPPEGPPQTLDDLARPEYASTFVTPNPESSSPGFAFLLATIARYGEDGWQDYWRRLAEGGVAVTSGWNEAYYDEFVAGGGDRALVTSYATSPVAEVVFAESPIEEPPTGVLTDGCYRQVEFAGVLAGTDQPLAAAKLVDFLLSPTVQEDIPLTMFVLPANSTAVVPEEFERWGTEIADALMLDPAEIEERRAEWTEEWVEIVLR
jgi:thiamine transport system substrate-binding protein